MIAGATRGMGGAALARHLSSEKGQRVILGPSRGLVSAPGNTHAQLQELQDLSAHGRTSRPVHHVHADPPLGLSDDEESAVRATFWAAYEREFGLEKAPFFSRIHQKVTGRRHEHRVYSLVRPDGSVVDLRHDYARREKVSRTVETEHGLQLIAGKHNRAVVAALEREGRHDVASGMMAAGLLGRERPVAPTTPQERAQEERTSVRKDDVRAAALAAWQSSDSGAALDAALAARGLRLARGDRTIQLVDRVGGTHDLRRTLAAAAKAARTGSIRATDVAERIAGLELPDLESARQVVLAETVPRRPRPGEAIASTAAIPAADPMTTSRSGPAASLEGNAHRVDKEHGRDGGHLARVHADAGADNPGPDEIDWRKPRDGERFLREWAAWWARREARRASVAREIDRALEEISRAAQADAERIFEWVRLLREALATCGPSEDLGRRPHRGTPERGPGGRPDQGRSREPGLPRDVPRDVRSLARNPHGAGAHPSPRLAEAAGEGSADADRAGRGATRGDSGEPDPARTVARRYRIEARRFERGLAFAVGTRKRFGELMTQLSRPPTHVTIASDAIDRDDERNLEVLRGEPRPIDVRQVALEGRSRVHDEARARDQAAEAAAIQLELAERRIGFLDRLAGLIGVRTSAVLDRDQARRKADQARRERFDRDDLEARIAAAERGARAIHADRQRERDMFELRQEVIAARLRLRANGAVRKAVEAGDREVTATAAHDLDAARAFVRRREREAQLRCEDDLPGERETEGADASVSKARLP